MFTPSPPIASVWPGRAEVGRSRGGGCGIALCSARRRDHQTDLRGALVCRRGILVNIPEIQMDNRPNAQTEIHSLQLKEVQWQSQKDELLRLQEISSHDRTVGLVADARNIVSPQRECISCRCTGKGRRDGSSGADISEDRRA